jgi:hypothetical protein
VTTTYAHIKRCESSVPYTQQYVNKSPEVVDAIWLDINEDRANKGNQPEINNLIYFGGPDSYAAYAATYTNPGQFPNPGIRD